MKQIMLLTIASLLLISCKSVRNLHSVSNAATKASDIEHFLLKQMDSLKIPALSFALINNSKIVYHKTFGVKSLNTNQPIDENSLFDAGSLTKTLFAYWTMKMVDKKLLDLDTPLYHYLSFPDIEYDERYKLITARMVLSHSTGFPNWRFLNGDKKMDIKFTPGTDFNYSGEGYEYLANVLAHLNNVKKDNLEINITKDVFEPLQMKNSSTIWTDRVNAYRIDGHIGQKVASGWGISKSNPGFYASYSLQTEARDYATLLMAIISGQGISPKMRDEMLRLQIKSKDNKRVWGLGVEIEKLNNGKLIYKHGGFNNNFSSGFLFSADTKNGYVFFANNDSAYELNNIFQEHFLK